jgi:hypothetical protein
VRAEFYAASGAINRYRLFTIIRAASSGCDMNIIGGFVRSKPGRMLVVFLVLIAGISAIVANYVCRSTSQPFFRPEGP